MTISTSDRRLNIERALRAMHARVGLDVDFETVFFDPQSDQGLSEIIPTTWRELKNRWYIDELRSSVPLYHLTASGWLETLRVVGALESVEVKERSIALLRALKAKSIATISGMNSLMYTRSPLRPELP